jgi:hypothetical protein
MLEEALSRPYPGADEHRSRLRARVIGACRRHLELGLGDRNSEQRLCDANDDVFWQQLSEVLVADQLARVGLDVRHEATGPDFKIEHGGGRTWIEVICPTAVGVPPDWLAPAPGQAGRLPHEAMLLRWTSAIKEKSEKLLGQPAQPGSGYLASGIVAEGDRYVIAVNARRLRSTFPQLEGISQFPFAVEATFSVGPYTVQISRENFEVLSSGHEHRPRIPKPNGAQVPADTFLDPRFAPISAVWAIVVDEEFLFQIPGAMIVVHNPKALNPIATEFLPARSEFVAADEGDHYRLNRLPGRLPIYDG